MASDEFFRITISDDDSAVWWKLEGPRGEDAYDVLLGESDPATLGVSLSVMSGTKLLDANGSDGWIFTVSERAVEAFQAAGVTGWDVAPVSSKLPSGEAVELLALRVPGRAIEIDYTNTIVDAGNPRWGRGFDISGWDGSDLFTVSGKGYLFCTCKGRDAINASALTNFAFTPTSEIEHPLSPELSERLASR